MNYYELGLRARRSIVKQDSRAVIGAASSTWVGTMADGIIAILLDVVHIVLLVGGTLMLWNTISR